MESARIFFTPLLPSKILESSCKNSAYLAKRWVQNFQNADCGDFPPPLEGRNGLRRRPTFVASWQPEREGREDGRFDFEVLLSTAARRSSYLLGRRYITAWGGRGPADGRPRERHAMHAKKDPTEEERRRRVRNGCPPSSLSFPVVVVVGRKKLFLPPPHPPLLSQGSSSSSSFTFHLLHFLPHPSSLPRDLKLLEGLIRHPPLYIPPLRSPFVVAFIFIVRFSKLAAGEKR